MAQTASGLTVADRPFYWYADLETNVSYVAWRRLREGLGISVFFWSLLVDAVLRVTSTTFQGIGTPAAAVGRRMNMAQG